MYWLAVQSELEAGCACVSFDESRQMSRHTCLCVHDAPQSLSPTAMDCDESCRTPCPLPIRVPSRIRPLIEELREVILAVVLPVPSPVPCKSSRHSTSSTATLAVKPRKLTAAESAGLGWIHEAFDVELIEQHLRYGVFDPSKLFAAVGDLLKRHCAPSRDAAVATMVEIASNCGPGKSGTVGDALRAIRMCFEVLELMRLVSCPFHDGEHAPTYLRL